MNSNVRNSPAADGRLGQSADPRALRTRKALQDALFELLRDTAFDAITPHQIAARAGVSRAAFYLHYASKEAMFAALARARIAELQACSQAALDSLGSRVAALALCEHVERDRTFWAVLFNGGAQALVRDEMLRHACEIADARAWPDDRLPPDLSTAYATSGTIEVLAWWLRQESPPGIEVVADLLVELVFNPIRTVSTSPHLRFR